MGCCGACWLPLAVLLVAATSVLGCGFDNQGCSSGSSDRQRRDIVFPGEEEHDVNPITKYLTPEQIDRLNDIDSLEEMFRTFSNSTYDVEPPITSARILPVLSSRIGGGPRGEARSEYSSRSRGLSRNVSGGRAGMSLQLKSHSPTVRQVEPAKCQPTLQPVALKKPDDLAVMYWPYCVKLERCGGCCIQDRQQSCQPTRTELVPFKVTRFLINSMRKNGMMKANGSEILHLERHTECRCSCIVKAEHCNALQEYSPRECRCNCGNADEKRKCLSEPNKLWDNTDCKCRCREFPPEGCTTGLYFDLNTCTCAAIPETRRRYQDNTYKTDKRRRRWQNHTTTPIANP